jgi:hypothetical protein
VIPWKVIFATLVIFCSGLVVGGLIVKKNSRSFANPHPFHGALTNNPPSLWHQQQKDFLRHMDHDLKLTPEQHVRIEKTLKESQERTKQIREKIAPEMREELKKVRDQIRAELTPEQQKIFDEAVKTKTPRKPDDGSEERRKTKDGFRRARTNAVSTNLVSP